MGVEKNIGASTWPRQGAILGKHVFVCFGYETSTLFPATCVRDDVEHPFRTIFKLDDERFVLAIECQWTPA